MSDFPTPKYSHGQTVYAAEVEESKTRVPCPDCCGKGSWHVVLPSGEEIDIECPTCKRGYDPASGCVVECAVTGNIRPYTIGSIEVNTSASHRSHPVAYMCKETGVGSGRMWSELDLHASPEEAEARLPALIEERNEQILQRADRARGQAREDAGRHLAYLRKQRRDHLREVEKLDRLIERQKGQA